jgi:hypothetical protein
VRQRTHAVVPAQACAQRDEDVGEALGPDAGGGPVDGEARDGQPVEVGQRDRAERVSDVCSVDALVVGERGGAQRPGAERAVSEPELPRVGDGRGRRVDVGRRGHASECGAQGYRELAGS